MPGQGQVDAIYLRPGELCFQEQPAVVSTVLGSCVSVTLFSPRRSVGAICHALLPLSRGCPELKYVDHAVDVMLQRFQHKGIRRDEIQAKLFGGSDMFNGPEAGLRQPSVGHQNVLAAREVLDRAGIPLLAQDVRGAQGRKILFHTHTGEVYLKRLGDCCRTGLDITGAAAWA